MQPSYLYGTIHMGSPRVISFDSTVIEKLSSCNVFAMELNPDEPSATNMVSLLRLPDSVSAKDYLNESEMRVLDSGLNALSGGFPQALKQFYPIVVSMMLVENSLHHQGKKTVSADIYLQRRAEWFGLDIISLESTEQQVEALRAIPLEIQYRSLMDALNGNVEAENLELLERLYLNQNLDSLRQYALDESDWQNNSDTILLDKRNRNMVRAMRQHWPDRSIFVAIGAAHLNGPNGVIAVLKAKGYEVEPIKFNFAK